MDKEVFNVDFVEKKICTPNNIDLGTFCNEINLSKNALNKWGTDRGSKSGLKAVPDDRTLVDISKRYKINLGYLMQVKGNTLAPELMDINVWDKEFNLLETPEKCLSVLESLSDEPFTKRDKEAFDYACEVLYPVVKMGFGQYLNLKDIYLFLSEESWFDNRGKLSDNSESSIIINRSSCEPYTKRWFRNSYIYDTQWENNVEQRNYGSSSNIEKAIKAQYSARIIRSLLRRLLNATLRKFSYTIPVQRSACRVGYDYNYFFSTKKPAI